MEGLAWERCQGLGGQQGFYGHAVERAILEARGVVDLCKTADRITDGGRCRWIGASRRVCLGGFE